MKSGSPSVGPFWVVLSPPRGCEIPETSFPPLPRTPLSFQLETEKIRKPEKEFLVRHQQEDKIPVWCQSRKKYSRKLHSRHRQDIHLRRLLIRSHLHLPFQLETENPEAGEDKIPVWHQSRKKYSRKSIRFFELRSRISMRKLSHDEIILSYNDVVLRRSDLLILGGPYYLNDRIIEFYLSYLSAGYPSDQILMVSPSIAFWIMNCPNAESLRDFMEPLNLLSRNLVIFPINNNDEVDRAEGGSHWSLLAFERNANVFVHHDSLKGMNDFFANRLYEAVVGFVGGSSDSSAEPKYVKCSSSPQQQNCYDCGLYVLAIVKVIHDWYQDSGLQDKEGLWFSTVKECVTPSAVSRLRGEISELIRGLMASC